MPLIPALILGGLCATAFGILFGLPSLRVKGLYLAVATLAESATIAVSAVIAKVPVWISSLAGRGMIAVVAGCAASASGRSNPTKPAIITWRDKTGGRWFQLGDRGLVEGVVANMASA